MCKQEYLVQEGITGWTLRGTIQDQFWTGETLGS